MRSVRHYSGTACLHICQFIPLEHELSIPVEQLSVELDDSSDEEVFAARTNARVTELEQVRHVFMS